ncbi:MAG: hypothetical protein ACE5G0_08890 [Rhodothermales bacterium]
MRCVGLVLAFLLFFAGCDHGLAPPDVPPVGSIHGVITYTDPSAWPAPDSLIDLRFFALPFVPQDTLDLFRDLNNLVFSERLDLYVAGDTFVVDSVEARIYIYSGVAQQYTRNLLDWRPVGLYEGTNGIFQVRPGQVTELSITVDFKNLPPFPPAAEN